MKSHRSKALCFVAVVAVVPAAWAEGRTDGPEGSEIGEGGYTSTTSGRLSLAVDWGGTVPVTPYAGAPLYFGGTVSGWMADWFLLDAYGGYSLNTQRLDVLVGPRFRTATWPVSLSAGLRGGLMYDAGISSARFGISPVVAADMVFMRHLLVGLQGAVDIPVGGNGQQFRIGLNIGWRF